MVNVCRGPFAVVITVTALFVASAPVVNAAGNAVIIDHTCTDIAEIPESAIDLAKSSLHIAYGHASHGAQITGGMTGLVGFANGGGLGLSLPTDIFAWNDGGTGGALDLEDYAMAGDLDTYPDWVDNTRSYLGPPDSLTGRGTNQPDVNVVVWAWCSALDDKYNAGTLESEYLIPMDQLEHDYPAVVFVYMTGHVNYGKYAATTAGNQLIRDFCSNNGKVLYDFADIESWDPDSVYYEFPDENCDYYASATGPLLGNWAIEWQSTHTENADWYTCDSPHSEPLNANQKAYAAWWLWTRLGGWPGPPVDVPTLGGGGKMLLAALLTVVAAAFLHKRRKAGEKRTSPSS